MKRLVNIAAIILLSAGTMPPSSGADPQAPPVTGDGGTLDFSFDEVGVRSFIKMAGDITGRKFVVSEGVSGKITVIAHRVKRDEIYPLFVTILESVGCSVVEENGIHKVIPLPARKSPDVPVIGAHEAVPASGVVTKVIALKHVSAAELANMLKAKVGGEGGVSALRETNHLVVTDTAESLRRIEKIVSEIDQPGLSRTMEVVRLRFAGAEELAEQLNMALAESWSRGRELKRRLPRAVGTEGAGTVQPMAIPSKHSNSLVLAGTGLQLERLKKLVDKMDVDVPSGRGHLNAIFLKYISAEEAAASIGGLLDKSAAKAKSGDERQIAIQASPEQGALLVDASPGDFEVVRHLIDQLDRASEQVHITVIIAEHSQSEGMNLGVEMTALSMPSEKDDTAVAGSTRLGEDTSGLLDNIQQGLFPRGITVGVARGRRVDSDGNVVSDYPALVTIDALKRRGDFEVLSRTSLEAENNREASIDIVNEIPILRSTIQGGSGTARDVIQNIERQDVGIKLKLKPHIIPGGDVRMELNPTIEAVVESGTSRGDLTPTIAKRGVSTTVTVPNGEMIVIAGLTRTDTTEVVKRVPLLGSIPLLGWLFRHTEQAVEKTNLLILVTPRIVPDRTEARAIMDEWKERTKVRLHEEEGE
ncbi:MAG: type II secretion system secretin GspD [Kiritimatiellia bacterium]